MSIKDITVIVATFESDKKIINCLNSINKECKIIIVENSNDIHFKENIEKKFNNVQCILAQENIGYGGANNIGLKNVKTKYALILNPDVILSDNSLENFNKAIETIDDFAILAPAEQSGPIAEDRKNENKILFETTNNVKGFAMLLKLSEFKGIGFFDESFFLYFEDIDLCKRLRDKNKKILLVSNLNITHLGAQSSSEEISWERELTRNWHWMWSTFFYQKKYNGFFISLIIVFPKLMSSLLKFFTYTFLKNNKKKQIYLMRYLGLINAIKGKSSSHRPKV